MPNLTQIEQSLQALFTKEATRLAQESGLVRRRSKLSGSLLLIILVSGFIQHPTASLNVLAQVAQELGVAVTRQAIHQRLNASAVTFFQTIFQQSLQRLQSQCAFPVAILKSFSAVYWLDSSQVALPDALAAQYPGTGGDGPQAGVKWQVLWDALKGNLQAVVGQPASQSDHRYRDYLDSLVAGSLILFDLGYVALSTLSQVVKRQASLAYERDTCKNRT